MKFIDALLNVDKSRPSNPNLDEFCQELDVETYDVNYTKLDDSFKSYYLTHHLCTDTWVGIEAIYLNDKLVAYTNQTSRKGSYYIAFINQECAKLTKSFLESCMEQRDPSYNIEDEEELNRELVPFYHVSYSGQLIDDHGFHNERPVTVLKFRVNPNDCIDQQIKISYDDTKEEEIIFVHKLMIPIKVNKEN